MKSAALTILDPKDRRPIYEWARDHYQFTPPLTKTDPLNISECRHFQSPFDSLQSDTKREVSVRAGVRSGKTLIGEVFVAWAMVNDPGETMWVTGKSALADQEWDTRMERMLLASPRCATLLPASTPQGSRRNKQTGLVEIRNGSNLFVHGNAELNLQQKGIRNAIHDEVWEWEQGRLAESYGRLGDYLKMGISKVLNISQGGDDESDWDQVYNQGNCQEWEVQCLSCGAHFRPVWSHKHTSGKFSGMRWDEAKDENGLWVIPKALATVRYECPHCAHPHTDTPRTKAEWNRTGRYVATNPNARPEKDSYHWTGVIDWPWVELVDMYLQACNARKVGNLDMLIRFFRKYMAETKGERSIIEDSMVFAEYVSIADLKAKLPDEDKRFLTIDVQAEHLWGLVCSWTKTGQCRRLWFGQLSGYADAAAKQSEYGVRVGAIDAGHKAHEVYAACARYGWIAFKGEGTTDGKGRTYHHKIGDVMVERTYSPSELVDPERGRGRRQAVANLIKFSSDTYNDRLQGIIEAGNFLEPQGTKTDPSSALFRKHMADEHKARITNDKGYPVWRWIAKTGENHGRDLAKMQTVLATITDVLPDL